MASKNFLHNLTIPKPCTADWNSMAGNDQVRFCEHCSLQVHNLSLMTRSQAERLVSKSNGRLCVRYHQDNSRMPGALPLKLHTIGRRVSRLAAGAFTATLSLTTAVAQNSGSSIFDNSNLPTATRPDARPALSSSLKGTITDQNGALITNATIYVLSRSSALSLYVSTNSTGQFEVENLAAGIYQVRVEAPGFAPDESDSIYLQGNTAAHVDRTLKVADIAETVEIESGTAEISIGGAVSFVAPENAFVRAAQEDDLEQLTALIAGMNVNLRDPRTHTTALEHAVRNANREMVQLLLNAGARVNEKNQAGETVLMMLDDDATSDLVWDLINAGAQVNLKDDDGCTALIRAASANSLEAVKTLLEAGADVNLKSKDGRTALMSAAAEGYVNTVRALVLAGADINAVDKENMNALALASEHLPVVRFLRSKGAFESVAKADKEE
ncbi:MAG TPA: ankyrin repeat domain-containing protein [Pyrinomonadaceae bacterium]